LIETHKLIVSNDSTICAREVVTTAYYLSLLLEFDLNFSTPFHKDLNLKLRAI